MAVKEEAPSLSDEQVTERILDIVMDNPFILKTSQYTSIIYLAGIMPASSIYTPSQIIPVTYVPINRNFLFNSYLYCRAVYKIAIRKFYKCTD